MGELRLIELELDFTFLCCGQECFQVLQMTLECLIFAFSFTAWRTNIAVVNEDGEEFLAVFISDSSEDCVHKRLENSWALLRSKVQASWEHDPSSSHEC